MTFLPPAFIFCARSPVLPSRGCTAPSCQHHSLLPPCPPVPCGCSCGSCLVGIALLHPSRAEESAAPELAAPQIPQAAELAIGASVGRRNPHQSAAFLCSSHSPVLCSIPPASPCSLAPPLATDIMATQVAKKRKFVAPLAMRALVFLLLSSTTALTVRGGASRKTHSSRRSRPARDADCAAATRATRALMRATAFDSYDEPFNPKVLTELGVPEDCVPTVVAMHKQTLELQEFKHKGEVSEALQQLALVKNSLLETMLEHQKEVFELRKEALEGRNNLTTTLFNLREAREWALEKEDQINIRSILSKILPRGEKTIEILVDWISGPTACTDLKVRVEHSRSRRHPLTYPPSRLAGIRKRLPVLRKAEGRHRC